MSRTKRRRHPSWSSDKYYTDQIYSGIEKWTGRTLTDKDIEGIMDEYKVYLWKEISDAGWSHGLPKVFRNIVNRRRRAKDNQELWKAINRIDYPEQCSKWNCKDNDHWSYW